MTSRIRIRICNTNPDPGVKIVFFVVVFHHRDETREILVQTGVIGICGRWPLAAPLLFGSRLAFRGGGGEGNGARKVVNIKIVNSKG